MGTLLTLLTLGAGFGGLGWWLSTRDDDERAPNARAAEPLPLALPPPPPELDPVPTRVPHGTRYAPAVVAPSVAIAPSDFVHRMRGWLEQGPAATQIDLVAVQLERAGHRETATQLRALAHDRRNAERLEPNDRRNAERLEPVARPEEVAADPPEPTSRSRAPAGSSESSPESDSDNSPSTDDGSGAPSEPSAPPPSGDAPANARAIQQLARRVAAMLHARRGQPTDRRLVRQFQLAARLFPAHGENPSGLYGPVTRDALVRYGLRNPPRPRFRAAVEAAPPRTRPAAPRRNAPRSNTPRPNTNRPSSAR